MRKAKEGDKVTIYYKGTLDDGSVFDESGEDGPLRITVDEGEVLPGIDEALLGMEMGENKRVTIPPEKGFGRYLKELLIEVDLKEFPGGDPPTIGQTIGIPQKDGTITDVIVKKVSGTKVTLDANHPLAGETLTFHLELININPRE